ncbi:NifB/NifX family molybdenum-iron cluster-binding protein [Thiobaca trueperi]|uniref:Nitrogen fixation protein NifX n=1 Tax=Thiobaca trueperi TaxID=127458 RepID=A0A4R3N1T0_9GAMM|nr:nitrogen fixation protein NifX [Thiobaca trueperi]
MTVERRLRILNCCSETKQMDTAVNVAFATSDRKVIDQHFGAAESFAIYAIDRNTASLIEVVQFGPLDMDGNESKLTAKIDALEGCVAVYCQAIGASAVNQLRARWIQPIKVAADTSITQTIRALQTELREGPNAWLARAIENRQAGRASRFDAMEAEGWDE